MKKVIGSIALASALLGSGLTVNAVEYQPETVKKFKGIELIEGEKVEVSSLNGSILEVMDESPSEEMAERLSEEITPFAAGVRDFRLSNKKPLGLNWYSLASAEATYEQDTIGAKVRLYKNSGTLWESDNQSEKNSKTVSATAKPGGLINNFNGAYSIGNYTFKRSGYIDSYPELRNDEW